MMIESIIIFVILFIVSEIKISKSTSEYCYYKPEFNIIFKKLVKEEIDSEYNRGITLSIEYKSKDKKDL